MPAPHAQEPRENVNATLTGFCPVCGKKVLWTPTARLWPSRRSAQSVLPGHSGTCPHCHRILMFTVVPDPAEDTGDVSAPRQPREPPISGA